MELVGSVQLVAGNSTAIEALFGLLKKEGIEPRGNPDVYVREYSSSFGVEEARELAARASSRAFGSAPTSPKLRRAQRVFIIVTPGMTSEAQNALLKTLEEPSGDALFFIVVPSPQTLLPTLRSRAQILRISSHEQELPVDPKTFLKSKPEKRIEILKPLLDKDEDDKKDIANIIGFLSVLETELSRSVEHNRDGLAAVYLARKYVGDKGSLTKALLEQVAL